MCGSTLSQVAKAKHRENIPQIAEAIASSQPAAPEPIATVAQEPASAPVNPPAPATTAKTPVESPSAGMQTPASPSKDLQVTAVAKRNRASLRTTGISGLSIPGAS